MRFDFQFFVYKFSCGWSILSQISPYMLHIQNDRKTYMILCKIDNELHLLANTGSEPSVSEISIAAICLFGFICLLVWSKFSCFRDTLSHTEKTCDILYAGIP